MAVMVYNTSHAEVLELLETEVEDHSVVNLVNMSLVRSECSADLIPSIHQYFTAFRLWAELLIVLGGLAVCTVLVVYVDTIRHVLRHSPSLAKTHTVIILSVYPVVSLATYCATIIPRAHLLAEAVTQGMFMVAMYQLFCLMVAYCGGESELISKVKPKALSTQVGPCCCLPCCSCLPTLHIDKNRIQWLRILVLQLPIVQGLVYLVLLVMWAEEQSLHQVNNRYVQPVVIVSILVGVWGIIMTMKMLTEVLQGYHIQGKFIVLQLVMILTKLQTIWAGFFTWRGWLPCNPPLTPTLYANLGCNSLMLWEIVVLSLCARHLYKKQLLETPSTPTVTRLPQSIHNINEKALNKNSVRC